MRLPRNFNPLHHEGGDVGGMAISVGSDFISIHSTTRVETMTVIVDGLEVVISIHSTTRVET